jgi:hypothetical protein
MSCVFCWWESDYRAFNTLEIWKSWLNDHVVREKERPLTLRMSEKSNSIMRTPLQIEYPRTTREFGVASCLRHWEINKNFVSKEHEDQKLLFLHSSKKQQTVLFVSWDTVILLFSHDVCLSYMMSLMKFFCNISLSLTLSLSLSLSLSLARPLCTL